jgi:Skp family chaperone for outer membrane proteins
MGDKTMRLTASLRLLAAGALLAAMALPASAAPKKGELDPSLPSFVDLGRVLAEYRKTPAFAKYQVKLRDQAKAFTEEMQALAQLRYCTAAERQEALTIKAKPKPSEKEQQRLDALMKKADTVENELSTLGQKQNPTEADKQRIQALSKMRTDAVQALAKEEADRRDKLRQLENDLLTEVEDNLLKVVDKVAKDNKLGTVYERRAVLVGGNDLTDEVIKRLPK